MLGPFGLAPRMTMRARAFQLARHLVSRGHKTTIMMPPWQTPEEAGRRWTEDGVDIGYVSLSPAVPILSEGCTTRRLLREALALEPDVVHVYKGIGHAGAAAFALYQMNRFARRRVALVVDQDDWEGRGGWNDALPRSKVAGRIVSAQERWALTHATAVTVASRELESLAWSLGIDPARVHHLPNGPREWRQGDGPALRERLGLGKVPVILLYTRFFEYDVARVAEAFRLIQAALPASRLLVVGQGLRPQDEARFCDLIEGMRLQGAVTRAGWVSEQELPDYFAAADVALYPFDDNLINRCKCPVKLTDLLYAGVPVAAEAVGEIREYIRHRESGLLVAPGNPRSLADAVLELLRDSDYATSLAQSAARDMRTRYAWSTQAEELVGIYQVASR
jgi:glycosyltransferase involved in cell wall biosynthesis